MMPEDVTADRGKERQLRPQPKVSSLTFYIGTLVLGYPVADVGTAWRWSRGPCDYMVVLAARYQLS